MKAKIGSIEFLKVGFIALFLIAALIFGGCVVEDGGASGAESSGTVATEVSRGVPEIKNPDADYGEIDIILFQAGKADAFIIRTENHVVMIDTGEEDDGAGIVEYLRQKRIKQIDYLIITHYDGDHIGGADYVFDFCEVLNVYQAAYTENSEQYKQYISGLNGSGALVEELCGKDAHFELDGVEFTVYGHREASYISGTNDYSLGVRIVHGERSFFFAGDAMDARMKELLTIGDIASDFLKVQEHGDYKKTSKEFIPAVNPYYAVITDSKKHPASEQTYEVLAGIGCTTYSTDTGNVYLHSDGKTIEMTLKG